MEHARIEELGDGFVRIVPDEGYVLYSDDLGRRLSGAVVRDREVVNFKAIEK